MMRGRSAAAIGVIALAAGSGCEAAEPATIHADLSHLEDASAAPTGDPDVGDPGRITDISGVSFTMAGSGEPVNSTPGVPGLDVADVRSWLVDNGAAGMVVNIAEVRASSYDLDAGLEGSADDVDGELSKKRSVAIDGVDGVAANVAVDDQEQVFRIALTYVDGTIVQAIAYGPTGTGEEVEAAFSALVESIDLP